MNHASITGNLNRDPELKRTQTGISACTFSLAVKRPFAKEENDVDWIAVQTWRQSAEYICSYAGKGDTIGVEGRIQTRQYTDRDGNNRVGTEIVANRVEIIRKAAAVQEQAYAETPYASQLASQNDRSDAGVLYRDEIDTSGITDEDLPF